MDEKDNRKTLLVGLTGGKQRVCSDLHTLQEGGLV